MMTQQIKQWFIDKVAQNPEYLQQRYLPALELEVKKAETRLREANRRSDINEIKYRQGWLDGVEKLCTVLDGLKISEGNPGSPGLMARIFPKRDLSPADHG